MLSWLTSSGASPDKDNCTDDNTYLLNQVKKKGTQINRKKKTKVSNKSLKVNTLIKHETINAKQQVIQQTREILSMKLNKFGKYHPDTLMTMGDLGTLLRSIGDLAESEQLFRDALLGWEKTLTAKHEETISCLSQLAFVLLLQGEMTEAESLYRKALHGWENLLGKDHPDTLTCVVDLALLLQNSNKLDLARPLLLRGLEGRKRILGLNHCDTIQCQEDYDVLEDLLVQREFADEDDEMEDKNMESEEEGIKIIPSTSLRPSSSASSLIEDPMDKEDRLAELLQLEFGGNDDEGEAERLINLQLEKEFGGDEDEDNEQEPTQEEILLLKKMDDELNMEFGDEDVKEEDRGGGDINELEKLQLQRDFFNDELNGDGDDEQDEDMDVPLLKKQVKRLSLKERKLRRRQSKKKNNTPLLTVQGRLELV